MNRASGTSPAARQTTVLRIAGRRLIARPINADSRTSDATRGPAECGESGERGRQVGRPVDESPQDRGVFNSLTAALAQMRTHRMGRVTN